VSDSPTATERALALVDSVFGSVLLRSSPLGDSNSVVIDDGTALAVPLSPGDSCSVSAGRRLALVLAVIVEFLRCPPRMA
jgi:hypothetical protein